LGWSCQRPSGRALERDEHAIAGRSLKKAQREGRAIGLSERSCRVRTQALCGHTPVLQYLVFSPVFIPN
jgi:hypothetical protein